MLGVQLGVSVLALRRAASRSDFLVLAICCPRALRRSDCIEHLAVRNLAPSMLAIVLAHDPVTHWHCHGRGSHEGCVAFLTHGDDIGIRRVQFHRSVCCQCQLLAAKHDLLIGIVYVASRGAPQVKIDTRGQDRLHVLPRCAVMTLRVFSSAPLIARPPAGRNQGRSTIERPYVLSIHVVIVPLSLHVNIYATEAGEVPRFGATSDMLQVKLRRAMSPNLWVSLQVAHMCIKLATDTRFDNSRGSKRRKRSNTHLDNGLAINTVITHAQLLGNMLSTICELEAAHGQTQTKKKTRLRTMQLNVEELNGCTVQIDRWSASSCGVQNCQ